jgi:hypothetical protein
MKKLIVTGAVFAAGFAAGGVVLQRDSMTATAQGAPTECAKLVRTSAGGLAQDVNGDGGFDISDAVYILNFLFTGGGAPKAICGGPLPATGQTGCWDTAGNPIDCSDAGSWPGEDGRYREGCSPEGRFVDNEDGTVTDTCTGLMWQKETPNPGAIHGATPEGWVTWESGLRYCEQLEFAGHSDWRLPNVQELSSLIMYNQPVAEAPTIAGPFQETTGTYTSYWTSTTMEAYPAWAWAVYFRWGWTIAGKAECQFDTAKVNAVCWVRAVRDAR